MKEKYSKLFRQKKLRSFPQQDISTERKKLLILGLALNMSAFEINTMLEYANMEQLCVKDKLEMIFLFVLENYYLENPQQQMERLEVVRYFTENTGLRKKYDFAVKDLLGEKNTKEELYARILRQAI